MAAFLESRSWRGVMGTPGTHLVKVMERNDLVKERQKKREKKAKDKGKENVTSIIGPVS